MQNLGLVCPECAMAETVKVIVCGDVRGRFVRLFDHVAQLNAKKGPFDLCLCVGDFFGSAAATSATYDPSELAEFRNGVKKVPIPTFFVAGAGSNDALELEGVENGGKLCGNLFFLGRSGIKTLGGLRVAYLSGLAPAEGAARSCFPVTSEVVDELTSTASLLQPGGKPSGVDIFLSNQWPLGVLAQTPEATRPPKESGLSQSTGAALVARACEALKPRYHFAGLEDAFYSRPPFRNARTTRGSLKFLTTRFYGLASAFHDSQRFLYAVGAKPILSMDSEAEPADTTDSPWAAGMLQQQQRGVTSAAAAGSAQAGQPQPWRWAASASSASGEGEPDRKRQRRDQRQQATPGADGRPIGCWFCLSSPQVETHLIVSVGTALYVAMAKGGIVPDHTILVPIQHRAACALVGAEAWREIDRYLAALRRAYAGAGKSMVVFERFVPSTRTTHAHLQIVPLPDAITEDIVEESFVAGVEKLGGALSPLAPTATLADTVGDNPYFWLELPSGKRLVGSIGERFPIQFGRDVFAMLMGCPQRADWHACVLPKDQEEQLTQQFRNLFQKYDPEAAAAPEAPQ